MAPAPAATATSDNVARRANVVFIVGCVIAALFVLPTLPSLMQDQNTLDISVWGLSVVIGSGLAISRRFRSFGSGLALAGAAAASWWSVQLIVFANIYSDSGNADGWIIQIVSSVIVALCGAVLFYYGRRLGVLHVPGFRWQSLTVFFAVTAVAGAVGLVIYAFELVAAVGGEYVAWIITSIVWLAALTICVPVLAVNAAPEQFRNGLLLAWLLFGADIWTLALRLPAAGVPANTAGAFLGLSSTR
jgi:hypothetical protein